MKTTKATSAKATKTAGKKTSVKNNPAAGAKTQAKAAMARVSSGDEVANQGQGVKKVGVPPRPKFPEDKLVDLTSEVNIDKKITR